jgi:class 3 adenylate cyclase/predicted ATPase
MRCAKCGTDSPDRTKFCPECGAPLRRADASPAGERRQVTVFFSDLVNSTRLSEALDPEQLHELYAEYQTICNEVARRYEGHIAHYLGDGVVAFFGYPTAHEDDAIRAVRSGLEIIQSLERVKVDGERLHLRVAIHTGLVVVGEVGGSDLGEQMVSGEVPNVAARLQAEAEPDTVVISDATRRLVEGHFILEDRGELMLKGISRPVQVFRVVGSGEPQSRFEARAAGGLTPLAGRERETELIHTLWSRAAAGEGQALLLRGEAGIGKSRLLGVAREAASSAGPHELFLAQCSPYHTDSELHPITAMLKRCIAGAGDASPSITLPGLEEFLTARGVALPDAVPLLANLLSVSTEGRYPPLALPPVQRWQRTVQALAGVLLGPPGASPVLLLIEDLHWADPSTLELVAALVERRRGSRVLLAITTREGEATPPSIRAGCVVHQVEALPLSDARALVSGVTGKRLPDGVAREIVQRTGGVPLFVEAVTRTIIESGALVELEDHFELLGPLPPGLIPATVHDSLMARIDRLGPARTVAQLASVIGRDFSFELLRTVCESPEDELRGALEQMVDLDLVSVEGQAPSSTYTFKHALLQDAAYDSLLKKKRQEFHGRIADVLLGRFRAIAEGSPDLLARHFEGAGRVPEAMERWIAAGLQAQHRHAERECVAYLRNALRLMEGLPEGDPQRIASEMGVQLALGPALMATQGWAARDVEIACKRARELCERTGNYQGLVAALWGLWTVLFVRAELERALEAANSVMHMAVAANNPILRVAAHHAVGFTQYFMGNYPAAREQAEAALELFDLEQERQLVELFQISSTVCCLSFLSQGLRRMGYVDQADHRHQELGQLLGRLANPAASIIALGIGMYHDVDRRDVDTIMEKANRGYDMATEAGFDLWGYGMLVYRGWARNLKGDVEGGLAELVAGYTGYLETGARLSQTAQLVMLAEALWRAGEKDAALEALGDGLRYAEELGERYYVPELHRVRAEFLLSLGDRDAAEQDLRRAVEIARGQQARLLELRSALVLARTLRDSGRSEEAREFLAPLYALFTEGFDSRELVEAHALLAALAAGDVQVSAAHGPG